MVAPQATVVAIAAVASVGGQRSLCCSSTIFPERRCSSSSSTISQRGSQTRTADGCVGNGAFQKKTWPVRPVTPSQVLYAGGASPPNTPGNAQEAAMARYRCNLPSAPSRTSISTAFMVPTSEYFSLMPGARGAQCRSRPLSAPADITAPVDASVSPTTIPPAQRVRPCYQQQQQHQQQAPPPSSGADGTPRCSEVEGRDVMRSFYAQHGSIARYGDGWGATRLLRCGASRGSCRRSSRPAPAQTTFRLHLDYMLPALFGARRDHTLAMT